MIQIFQMQWVEWFAIQFFFSPSTFAFSKIWEKGHRFSLSLFFFLSSYSISQNEFSFLLGNINVMYSKCDCPLICRQLIFVKRIRCLPSVAIEIPIFTPKLIAFIAKSAGIRKRGGGRTRWSGLQSAEKERGEGGKKSEEARSWRRICSRTTAQQHRNLLPIDSQNSRFTQYNLSDTIPVEKINQNSSCVTIARKWRSE